MKKGLFVYKAKFKHKNIGDYVQSIAAEQYTGRDVVYVEREHTHEYKGEPIKMIMNGWFMHVPESFPPSEEIIPLLTSVHINPDIAERMLSAKSVEYLKKHGPIGCRDRGTEKILKAKGVPCYFSGCLTLTLGKTYQHNPDSKRVCFVDAHHDNNLSKNPLNLLNYIFTLLWKKKLISKIAQKLNKASSFRDLLWTSAFYCIYSPFFTDEVLVNAEYINHLILESTLGSEDEKFEMARSLLNKYADSCLVVTSRIHAALPCLGMGTPVIFIVSDDLQPQGRGLQPEAKGRFDGLLEHFNVMEYLNHKLRPIFGFNPKEKIGLTHSIRNKQTHLKLAEELEKACTAFMSNSTENVSEFVDSKVL